MKSVKSKYANPTVRTVGQLSCGGKLGSFSSSPLGSPNMLDGEPVRNVSEHDNPWSKLHRTFSNSPSPRNFPHAVQHPLNEHAHFCSITDVKEEEGEPELQDLAPMTHKTESGVQVDMFHCKECRRHIKYGKTFQLENGCSESDSENNQLASKGCPNCERKTETICLPEGLVEDVEENKENEGPSLECQPSESPRESKSASPRLEVNTGESGNEILPNSENGTEEIKLNYEKGWKQSFVANIKVMTFAIVFIPVILHIIQMQNISSTISKFSIYFRHIILQEEKEEQRYSMVGWVLDLFFGVQGYAKPLPLILYLF